jgi:hypothetical protein
MTADPGGLVHQDSEGRAGTQGTGEADHLNTIVS